MNSQETVDDVYFQLAELRRLMGNILRPGTVKSFQPAAGGTAVLDIGCDTHNVPTGQHSGLWHTFQPGQQIVLLCPDGDPANGVVVPWGYKASDTPPSNRSDEHVQSYGSGDDRAALRTRDQGHVHAEVKTVKRFKLKIGSEYFYINPDALLPTTETE